MGRSDPASGAIVKAVNGFGFRLLAQLANEADEANVIISPWSVALTLGLAYNGAEGRTARSIAETLGVTGIGLDAVNYAFEVLRADRETPDPDVRVDCAVSLWARDGLALRRRFVQRAIASYGAQVEHVAFDNPATAAKINAWVDEHTVGRITTLVDEDDLDPATMLVLLGGVAFHGVWTAQFETERTTERDWTPTSGGPIPVRMMAQSGHYGYYENDRFQAASLPYGAGQISMYLLRPANGLSLATFREELTAKRWETWVGAFREADVDVRLPRFTVEEHAELRRPLEQLGMGEAFGAQADLGAMLHGPGSLSEVHHGTYVAVDEHGTEAAAATAAVVSRSLNTRPFVLNVDRPFFFAIRDNRNAMLLFVGMVERLEGGEA